MVFRVLSKVEVEVSVSVSSNELGKDLVYLVVFEDYDELVLILGILHLVYEKNEKEVISKNKEKEYFINRLNRKWYLVYESTTVKNVRLTRSSYIKNS